MPTTVAVSRRSNGKTLRKPKPDEGSARVLSVIRENGIKIIDLRFCDLLGQWQHFSLTRNQFDESAFIEGLGFDGSSIRGFKRIHESDMLLVPDTDAFFIEPFTSIPTLSIICDVKDPMTLEWYPRDPRNIAAKAEQYLRKTGIADTAYFGPEPEFFILDHARFDQSYNYGFYYLDSDEGFWNSGKEANGTGNHGHRPRYKEGYFPVPPTDHFQDIRSEIVHRYALTGKAPSETLSRQEEYALPGIVVGGFYQEQNVLWILDSLSRKVRRCHLACDGAFV